MSDWLINMLAEAIKGDPGPADRGHIRVVPGDTSARDQKGGHIKVGFDTMLPVTTQGLGPDDTKGGINGR